MISDSVVQSDSPPPINDCLSGQIQISTLYDGSVLAIDPKGELARITVRARRQKGQKVVVLDPFNESGVPSGRFNPLDEIDPASQNVKDDAGQIADALIVANERDPHWTDSARILIKALILYTLTLAKEDRHLVTVWRLLNGTVRRRCWVKSPAKRTWSTSGSTTSWGTMRTRRRS